MAVYYAWLAQRRGPGGDKASLLAYAEGHREAFVAGPGVVRGGESGSPIVLSEAVKLVSS